MRLLFRYVGLFLSVVLVIAVVSLSMKYSSLKELNSSTRKNAPGKFIKLTGGYVNYDIYGDTTNPVIVLVHGANLARMSWKYNVDSLVNAGFSVITYDIFGRGYSDRPKIDITVETYINQLDELLEKLSITKKINIVGVSMGGAIATLFAHKHPDRIEKIALLCPAAPYVFTMPKGKTFMSVATRLYRRYTNDGPKSEQQKRIETVMGDMKETMQYKGVGRTMISLWQNLDKDHIAKAYEELGTYNLKGLLLWGDKDHLLSYEYHNEVLKDLPEFTFYTIPNGGHLIHIEYPSLTNKYLIDFFKS